MEKKKVGRPKKIIRQKYIPKPDEETIIQNDSFLKKLYNNIKNILKGE